MEEYLVQDYTEPLTKITGWFSHSLCYIWYCDKGFLTLGLQWKGTQHAVLHLSLASVIYMFLERTNFFFFLTELKKIDYLKNINKEVVQYWIWDNSFYTFRILMYTVTFFFLYLLILRWSHKTKISPTHPIILTLFSLEVLVSHFYLLLNSSNQCFMFINLLLMNFLFSFY